MGDLILGIDPGSRQTGYAVLQRRSGTLRALRCDVIRLAHTDDHSERLQILFEQVSRLVNSFNPDACSIETPVYGVDPLAMLKLGRAQAAAMLAMTDADLPVFEYYPKAVKKSVTGNGNASKKQVAFMLQKTVTLPEEIGELQEDATDALAVAWCHLMKQQGIQSTRSSSSGGKKHQNRKQSSWAEFVKQNPDRIKD